jgi:HEAT repeat protein
VVIAIGAVAAVGVVGWLKKSMTRSQPPSAGSSVQAWGARGIGGKAKADPDGTSVRALADSLKRLAQMSGDMRAAEEAEALIQQTVEAGPTAISGLLAIIRSGGDIAVRDAAARALAQIGTEGAVQGLLRAIQDEQDEQTRDTLTRNLQALENRAAGPALVEALLATEDHALTAAIREATPRVGNSAFVEQLVAACHRTNLLDWQRVNLLSALSEVQDPGAVTALVAAVWNDTDDTLRRQALTALGDIGTEEAVAAFADIIDSLGVTEPQHEMVQIVGAVRNKETMAYLIELLNSTTNAALRLGVATALSRAGAEGREVGLRQMQDQQAAAVTNPPSAEREEARH